MTEADKSKKVSSAKEPNSQVEPKQTGTDAGRKEGFNAFILEEVFEKPVELLSLPSIKTSELAMDSIFALDANALLAPFGVGKAGQEEITTLYRGLREHDRIFAPAHAVREYLKHRSQKIAAMTDLLNQGISALGSAPSPPECAMLEYSKEYENALKAGERLRSARKNYLASMQELISLLSKWQWDDPVSALYSEVFNDGAVVECSTSRDDLLRDLSHRTTHNIPPGYKDKAKSDGGISDVIIWHTLMELAKTRSVDVVFVSNDEKTDWMVRSGSGALIPRFELIAEFTKKTRQRLSIVSYIQFLELHELSPATVDKVRHSYAEGLGRFGRLRERTMSILESLAKIASDYQYASGSQEYHRIVDNRFDGLTRGLEQCITAYSNMSESGAEGAFHYLESFRVMLSEMRSLNSQIEYEEARMKRDTTSQQSLLAGLCRAFVEKWDDFKDFTNNTTEW
jgi:hypothetical protein